MMKIKKDDQVIVITGKDKGKTGKVMHVFPKESRVIVEKINMVKKTQRRTQDNQQGGFVEIERPIHVSNIMLLDRKSKKGTRIGFKILKDGSKSRVGKRSGEAL